MSILEILWILVTICGVFTLSIYRKGIYENDIPDLITLISMIFISILFMIIHWIDILIKTLW